MRAKVNPATLIITSLLLVSTAATAIDGCIQNPRRSEPCPHQIYRMMQLKKDEPAKVTCICLEDFKHFLVEPKDETERMLRKMELKQLAAELQLTEEQVANLAKR